MPWTRDDTRYLVALLAALGLVGFLLAGNFGLVPSPIAGERVRAARTQVEVPQVSEAPATVPPTTPRPAVTKRPSATPVRTPARSPTTQPGAQPTPRPPTPSPSPCLLGLLCL
jgi:hypothetical protein